MYAFYSTGGKIIGGMMTVAKIIEEMWVSINIFNLFSWKADLPKSSVYLFINDIEKQDKFFKVIVNIPLYISVVSL